MHPTKLILPSSKYRSVLTSPEQTLMTHILTVLSFPPLTILSATKSTQYTSSVWPGRSVLSLYVFKSQIYARAND